MTTFVLSGDLRSTTFSAIRSSLSTLGPAITVHHDVDLDWCEPDVVDITFESSAALDGQGCDYVVGGSINDQLDGAIARIQRLAELLERGGIVYRLELDRDDGQGQTVVLQSEKFPGYPAG